MNKWAARLLLRLYPRRWRERYGDEFAALLARQPLTWESVLDITRGAYDARCTAARRHGQRVVMSAVQATTSARRKEQTVATRQRIFKCSFCEKNQAQAQRLIAGPQGVYICDECVHLCHDILTEGVHPGPSAEAVHEARHAHVPWWRRLGMRWQSGSHTFQTRRLSAITPS